MILVDAFVELADTLVDDFDVIDLLTVLAHRCVEVLGVTAAGLMLVAPGGALRVMASSSETMRTLELFEVQAQQGPCVDCYRTGQSVVEPDLASDTERWPQFSAMAVAAGFGSAAAFPMRLRTKVIGALNVFSVDAGAMRAVDERAAQALADVATIGILQHRAVVEGAVLIDQLNDALQTRIVIEQAKGMLVEREGLEMDQAFSRLRSEARNTNRRLTDVARDVIAGLPLGP